MMKRFALFIGLNLLVITTIGFLLQFFNVQPYLTQSGLDYGSLLVFSLIYGFTGAFISLLISRRMAIWTMGVQVIEAGTRDPQLQALVAKVHHLAKGAGLSKMPWVGIYNSPDLNAFATGPSKSSSLVAVSSGLLQRMDESEIEGVLAHEIAHIANGDMVTMTLLQGVVNSFVIFFSRVCAFFISQLFRSRDSEESSGLGHWGTFAIQIVLEIVFMLLGSILLAWFSRQREFRADAGGAKLAGQTSMRRALEKLKRTFEPDAQENIPNNMQAMLISSPGRFARMFSTHPPLSERIARLQG